MRDSWRFRLPRAPKMAIIGTSMLVVGLMAGLLGGAALAATDTKFYGCLNEFTGALLKVNTKAAPKCGWGERNVTWNQQGVKGEKGDTGEKGEPGAKGDPGPAGPVNVESRFKGVTVDASNSTFGLTVDCNPGEVATGGGFYVIDGGDDYTIGASGPLPQSGTPTSWVVHGRKATGTELTIQAYVICASS